MKPTLKLWLAAVAAVLAASWNSDGAVREVPPGAISTFLDAFPQTLRLGAVMPVGTNRIQPTWEFLAPGIRPTPMWVPVTNGPSFAFRLKESTDGGLYRAIAVDGYSLDVSDVRLSVVAPIAEFDPLRLQPTLQSSIYSLLPLADGGLVRGGFSLGTGDAARFGLGLHRANGTADPAWSGLADTSSINLPAETSFLVIAAQRTGGLIAGTEDGRVLRVDPSGQWDAEFSNRNLFQARVQHLTEDSAGRIVVGTFSGLWRLLPDGTKDGAFQRPAELVDATIQGLHVFADNSMVVARRVGTVADPARAALIWLRPDGSLDPERPRREFDGEYQAVNVVAGLEDQSVVIGGIFTGLGGVPSPNLLRVTRAGVIDPAGGTQLPMDYYHNFNAEIKRIAPLRMAGQNALIGQVAEWHGVKLGLDSGRVFWSSRAG